MWRAVRNVHTLRSSSVAFIGDEEAGEVRMRMKMRTGAMAQARANNKLFVVRSSAINKSGAPVVVGTTLLTRGLLHGAVNIIIWIDIGII